MRFGSVGQILFELDRREMAFLREETAGRPVVARMVAKRGLCELEEGAVLTFAHPGEAQQGVCPGLLRALRPFLAAAAMGIPAGEEAGYLVSCPSAKGTLWLVQTQSE